MRPRPALLLTILAVSAPFALSGCERSTTPVAVSSSAGRVTDPVNPRSQLAARAAAAKDRRYVAGYTLARSTKTSQSVLVTVATDGTWRVDVQGGALSGGADVALIGRPDGQYQCATGGSAAVVPGCVRLAGSGQKIPQMADPRVQYPFTTWLELLTDPAVAVTVITTATPLPNAAGTCFAVEPTTVTLTPPIPSSVICFAEDGTMTGAKSSWGTMILSGTPAAPPQTITLPGAVVNRSALPTSAAAAPSTVTSLPPGLPVSPLVPGPR